MPKLLVRSNVFPRQQRAQLDALTRADLLAISRHKSRTATLPDDVTGERILHGLLMKGLPATQVLDVAPWASQRGIEHYVEKAKKDRRTPDAEMLGDLIGFYFDDLKAMKREDYSVRHVVPCDTERWRVDEYWKAEERNADRERKLLARNRSKETAMPKLTKRAEIIYKAVGTNWISVPAIMNVVASKMRNERNRMLAQHTLRVAVGRGVDELVACGLAEAKMEIDERSKATRFTRRSHMTGRDSVHVHTVNLHKKASDDVASQ